MRPIGDISLERLPIDEITSPSLNWWKWGDTWGWVTLGAVSDEAVVEQQRGKIMTWKSKWKNNRTVLNEGIFRTDCIEFKAKKVGYRDLLFYYETWKVWRAREQVPDIFSKFVILLFSF